METEVGKIIHYYGNIQVGIVELSDTLNVGDSVRIQRGEEEILTQTVDSMQVEHKQVETAGPGDTVGLKVDQPVKEGDVVYK